MLSTRNHYLINKHYIKFARNHYLINIYYIKFTILELISRCLVLWLFQRLYMEATVAYWPIATFPLWPLMPGSPSAANHSSNPTLSTTGYRGRNITQQYTSLETTEHDNFWAMGDLEVIRDRDSFFVHCFPYNASLVICDSWPKWSEAQHWVGPFLMLWQNVCFFVLNRWVNEFFESVTEIIHSPVGNEKANEFHEWLKKVSQGSALSDYIQTPPTVRDLTIHRFAYMWVG